MKERLATLEKEFATMSANFAEMCQLVGNLAVVLQDTKAKVDRCQAALIQEENNSAK